nr:MAG TPA: Alginate and motility regulator [Caudoviricetes sp.]
MPEKKNSDARIRANNRYNEKAYDRINIAVPKGKKEVIQTHAKEQGKSLNGYINEAIDNQMERDKKEG